MSSNKGALPLKRRFFGTVKFKVAVWYAALFSLSAALSFVVIHSALNRNMMNSNDIWLDSAVREIVFEYFTGSKVRRFDREIPIAQIPDGDMAKFLDKVPGLVPVFAFERNIYRTLVGYAGQNLYEMRIESRGGVYSRQLIPAEHIPSVQRTFNQKILSEGSNNIFFRLLDGDGKIIAQSEMPEKVTVDSGALLEHATEEIKYYTVILAEHRFRLVVLRLFDGNILEIGRSLERMDQRLEHYSQIFFSSVGIILCLGAFGGWLIARKFIAGVERVSEAAQDIAGGNFSRRVQIGQEGQEIDHLVEVFNRMNANTERLFEELRMVSDNIAHDLRTPLTRIRGMAEITACGPQELPIYRDMAGAVADECNNLLLMINTMLEITRTESSLDELKKQEFNLSEILRQGHELLSVIAEEKEVECRLELPFEPVMITADRIKIQRMVANLLENAIKFTPEHGVVILSLAVENGMAVITVQDSGCGIGEEDLKHVFERFYRSDSSRTLPGNGLGLALVHAIVEAHHGQIEVSSQLGQGTVFRARLPLQ